MSATTTKPAKRAQVASREPSATAVSVAAPSGPLSPAVAALAEPLAAASALLTVWRLSLPAEEHQAGTCELSRLQVAMRAIAELLEKNVEEYARAFCTHPAGLELMFAHGLADTIESALWNMVCGDADEELQVAEFAAAVRQVQHHLRLALEAVAVAALRRQKGGV